jgi:hypothetical protein
VSVIDMKLDLVYADTRDELARKIEIKASKGWSVASGILVIHPPNLDIQIPNFVYYVQIITKGNKPKPLPQQN